MDKAKFDFYYDHFCHFSEQPHLWSKFKKHNTPGYLYAVRALWLADEWKLGRTSNLRERMLNIQRATPTPLYLSNFVFHTNTYQAELVLFQFFEFYLCARGLSERRWGECFNAEQEAIYAALSWFKADHARNAGDKSAEKLGPTCGEKRYLELLESESVERRVGINLARMSCEKGRWPLDFIEVGD